MELRKFFFSIPLLFFLLLSSGVLFRLRRCALAKIASDGFAVDPLCAVDVCTIASFNEHTCLTSKNFPSKWVLKNVSTMLTDNHTARRGVGDHGSKHGIWIVYWTAAEFREETAQARIKPYLINIHHKGTNVKRKLHLFLLEYVKLLCTNFPRYGIDSS
jgi:hypothetical protein